MCFSSVVFVRSKVAEQTVTKRSCWCKNYGCGQKKLVNIQAIQKFLKITLHEELKNIFTYNVFLLTAQFRNEITCIEIGFTQKSRSLNRFFTCGTFHCIVFLKGDYRQTKSRFKTKEINMLEMRGLFFFYSNPVTLRFKGIE